MILSAVYQQPVLRTTLVSALCFSMSFPALSASMSLRLGQYKQNLVVGENETYIRPSGYDLSASFDISPNLVIHLDYGHYVNDSSFLHNNTLDYEKDNWGLGLSYYLDNWSFSTQYSDLDELLTITNNRHNLAFYEEDYQSPGYLISVAYDFDNGTADASWLFSVSSSLQYNDWQLNLIRVERPIENEIFNTGIDKGDTLFADVSFSAARFIPLFEQDALYVGGSLGWNHLISGKLSIVSRNGISAQQYINAKSSSRNRLNQSSFSHSVHGDQYGLASLFVSYNLSDNLSVDLDYSASFAADENSDGVYLTLGYLW